MDGVIGEDDLKGLSKFGRIVRKVHVAPKRNQSRIDSFASAMVAYALKGNPLLSNRIQRAS